WHFFAILAGVFEFATDPHNQDETCNTCEASKDGNSQIQLHSGHLTETHLLAPYQSLGASRGVELFYDTGRLPGDKSFFFRYPDLGSQTQNIGGVTGGAAVEVKLEVSLAVRGESGQTSSSFEEVLASAVQGGGTGISVVVPGNGRPFGR